MCGHIQLGAWLKYLSVCREQQNLSCSWQCFSENKIAVTYGALYQFKTSPIYTVQLTSLVVQVLYLLTPNLFQLSDLSNQYTWQQSCGLCSGCMLGCSVPKFSSFLLYQRAILGQSLLTGWTNILQVNTVNSSHRWNFSSVLATYFWPFSSFGLQ